MNRNLIKILGIIDNISISCFAGVGYFTLFALSGVNPIMTFIISIIMSITIGMYLQSLTIRQRRYE